MNYVETDEQKPRIDRITKETVILSNTDHKCQNCDFAEIPPFWSDRGYYCKKNRHGIKWPTREVCRNWGKRQYHDDDEDEDTSE